MFWLVAMCASIPSLATAAPRLDDLTQTRCWVAPDRIACPTFQKVHGERDAGYVVLDVVGEGADETWIVHVGSNYSGTVSFEPELGVTAVRALLRRGRFSPAPPAREILVGAWTTTTPRSRLVYTDKVQLDAVLEVDCGHGRLVRDQLTVSGERFFLSRIAGYVAIFGRIVEGDRAFNITMVNHRVVDVKRLCRNGID